MEECIFCKIIQGEIPSEKVYEDDEVLAFKDINPEAPVHVIAIPKKHISSINELNIDDAELIGKIIIRCRDIAQKSGIDESGYRIVSNCGENAGQTVPHIHFHLFGGRILNWPPG